jgi:phenylacetic acid degradation operon negative regulatory protein
VDGTLGIRPFNARSLVLSVLLGLDPPVLPTRSLVALAELFEIAEGTMRTALSRMVAAGELVPDGDGYRLIGRLLERKEAQDIGRRRTTDRWDGDWWLAVVTVERRTVAARRAFRTHMANLRMGELRPETWLRPTNLDGPGGGDGLAVIRGPLRGEDPAALAGRLWPLGDLQATSDHLLGLLDRTAPGESLPGAITLSAAIVRFLRTEPLLPPALTPQPWSPDALRARYREHDRALGRALARTLQR